MTIRIGRKAWANRVEQIRAMAAKAKSKPTSVTKCFGEQVIVDLSLPDYAIRRDKQTSGRASQ